MSSITETDYRNILIIKPSAAGDIICALPVLAALRRKYPQAKISWLVASHLADLLRGHPMLDQVIEFHRRRYGYLTHSWSVTKRFLGFLGTLRRSDYDLVIDLQGLFRSGFFAWATRAGVRVGPAEKRELGWIFYTHRLPPRPHDTHSVDRMAAVGELLGLDLADPRFVVHIPDAARDKIANWLRDHHLAASRFVALAPGGTWPSKRWPADRFGELARRIIAELALPVVVIGGRAEKTLAETILRPPASNLFDLTAQTTLPELLAVLANAAALVCNDSGPMHMAVALGRPVTALIGPTNAARTGPYRRPQGIVQSAQSCSPCYKRHCPRLAGGQTPPCLEEITVDQVFANLKSQLSP